MPEVVLPKRHAGQIQVAQESKRFNVLACGRRWGKTKYGCDVAAEEMLDARHVGWFAPTSDYYYQAWETLCDWLYPVIERKSEQTKRLDLKTGGTVKLWSIHDKADAGRGEKYHKVIVDEAAMVPHLKKWWNEAGRATLADYGGTADFLSTPKGLNGFYELYQLGLDPHETEWACWQMPTRANPHIDPDEIEAMRRGMPERVFEQEVMAQFLEDGSGVFRGVSACIDKGRTKNEKGSGEWFQAGLDVARHEDYTVLTVFDDRRRQVWWERINQVSWERVYAMAGAVYEAFGCRFVVDSTGVGDAIYDRLCHEGIPCVPYNLTNASKEALVDNLAVLIEHQQVRLMDHPVQTGELTAYQYELLPSGRLRMGAPSGMHDDCVIALALGAHGLSAYEPIEIVRGGEVEKAPLVPQEADKELFERNTRILQLERERKEDRGELEDSGFESPVVY